jgi:hypothetical protein
LHTVGAEFDEPRTNAGWIYRHDERIERVFSNTAMPARKIKEVKFRPLILTQKAGQFRRLMSSWRFNRLRRGYLKSEPQIFLSARQTVSHQAAGRV